MSLLLGAVLLGNLGVCATAAGPVMLARPTQVRFDSVDYKNIVTWTPASNSSSLHYYVQWKIYGEPRWLDVDGCQGIKTHQCDLSVVTSDLREWYYARVCALSSASNKSAWSRSPRFSPRWDSKISSPVLRLSITAQGIVVHAKATRTLVQKMQDNLQYKIYLIHTNGEEDVFDLHCCSNKLTLTKLQRQVKYCVQAQTVISPKSSARSSAECVTTL